MGPEPIQHADYVAPNVEPFEGSCDCCAEGSKRIVHVDQETSAYVCEDCCEQHLRALEAAAEALQTELPRSNLPYRTHIASLVVKAYLEFTDDEHDRGT